MSINCKYYITLSFIFQVFKIYGTKSNHPNLRKVFYFILLRKEENRGDQQEEHIYYYM